MNHEVEYTIFEESLMDEIHQLNITIGDLESEIAILTEALDFARGWGADYD